MNEPTVYTAEQLKANLMQVLDDVARSSESIVVTAHGQPVVRIVPFEADAPLAGSVTFHASDQQLVAPLEEAWGSES